MILGDLIQRNAALHGDRLGLVFEELRFTHREFARRVYRASNALLGKGIRQQERVAILSRNRNEVLELFGAGELTGFIPVAVASEPPAQLPPPETIVEAAHISPAASHSDGLIEVELPSGVKLRLTGDIDEAALRRVLSALS